MQLKIFFYYINVILAKGQNNVIERVYGQREGQRRDQHVATRDGCLILFKEIAFALLERGRQPDDSPTTKRGSIV